MEQETEKPSQPDEKITKVSKKKRRRRKKPQRLLGQAGKRGRPVSKPFPGATFESVLPLAKAIFDHAGASREMRRLTVFDKLGKGPESGPSRMLVVNSSRYGLTVGAIKAEHLKLTEAAVRVLDPAVSPAESTGAKFALAIKEIPPFFALYEKFNNGKLPAPEVMKDALTAFDLDPADKQACVDIFVENAKYVNLLRVMSGAERLLSIEHVIEESGAHRGQLGGVNGHYASADVAAPESSSGPDQDSVDFESICFFAAPIGEDGTVERKHSDMVLSKLVELAVEPLNLKVVRADMISTPGMISRQIVEYLLHSKLVVVDLSFHNPNAFYELALRHVIGRPIVHLIRKCDQIPFDVGNFRTVRIDDSDMYDLIAKLDTYRAEIANQVRQALQEAHSTDNPILAYCPGLKVTLPAHK